MTKQQQYQLNFTKLTIPNWGLSYQCLPKNSNTDAIHLSELLGTLDDIYEVEYFLNQINLALNNQPYEPNLSLNWGNGEECEINPPNALLGWKKYEFPLTELKLILEEWIAFLKS